MGCEGDDGHLTERRIGSDHSQDFVAIHLGQRNVQQHQVGLILGQSFERSLARFIGRDVVLLRQNGAHEQLVVWIVLDDGDFFHSVRKVSVLRDGVGPVRRRLPIRGGAV